MRGISRSAKVALGCLAAFVVLTLALIGGPLPQLDLHVRHWAVTHQDPGIRRIASDAVWLGDIRVAGSLLLAVALLVAWRARNWRALLLPLGLAALLAGIVTGLKIVIGRADASYSPNADLGVGARGYPSGHVAAAAVCFGLSATLLAASFPRLRPWVVVVATAATVLTAASMIYGPAHWFTDTVGSAVLVGAALGAFHTLDGPGLSRCRRRRWQA